MKNIMKKLLLIRKDLDGFVYDSRSHTGQYAGGSQVLHKFRESANKHNVMLTQSTKNHSLTVNQSVYKDTKKGFEKITNHYVVDGEIEYTYFDIDSGESLVITQPLIGTQTDPSQAIGSALTYAERYQISKQFSVPTDKDDPDARKKTKDEPETEDNIIPTPKGKANGWTWETASEEHLREISETSKDPNLIDLAENEMHRRNMKEMRDRTVKIIKDGIKKHGDKLRSFLKTIEAETVDSVNKMNQKQIAALHVKVLAKIQELDKVE